MLIWLFLATHKSNETQQNGVAMFHAWVLLGRDHGDLGLGSVKEYRRPEVFLTTSLFLEQGLVAPFCGAGVFVDRD